MALEHFDLAVIGSGPAGFKAALTAARLGRRVAIVDREDMFGGVALRTGGIPSKALREAVLHVSGFQQRLFYAADDAVAPHINRQQLADRVREVVRREVAAARRRLQGHDVTFLPGMARFHDAHTLDIETPESGKRITADFILIACGTRPSSHAGIPVDHDRIMNTDSVTGHDVTGEVSQRLVVAGAGVIGLEYASLASVLGMQVTVIDARNEVLPFLDREIAAGLHQHLQSRGMEFRLGEQIEGAVVEEDHVVAWLKSGQRLQCDRLLYAGFRMANTDRLHIETIGLPVDERGQVRVDEHFKTVIPHVYAAGDIVGFPTLVSTSIEQGRVAANHMFGEPCTYDINFLPLGIYTIPEIAMVGRTAEKLADEGVPYGVGIARFSDLAKGQLIGDDTGMLKLLFDLDRHTLLGVHVIGVHASEILHVGHMAMMLGGTMEFLRDTVFNFPTMAEAYKAAADDGLSRV
ncbi:MAG: Si-specific NAD(P)(+) transhydrogenase [Candidatus Entotheonellia bacterium]